MTSDDAAEFEEADTKADEAASPISTADVVWHPIRLRIMNALSPNRRLTTPQIGALLPDVATPSLYRHLKTLVDAEVVQLIETPTPRGTMEKQYTLPEQETVVDLANARPEDLVRYFTTFASALLTSGRQFFGQPDAEKRRGGNYSANALYLTEKEYEYFCAALEGLSNLAKMNRPEEGRRRRMFYTAILPEGE